MHGDVYNLANSISHHPEAVPPPIGGAKYNERTRYIILNEVT